LVKFRGFTGRRHFAGDFLYATRHFDVSLGYAAGIMGDQLERQLVIAVGDIRG
jgi:hypothetical protein